MSTGTILIVVGAVVLVALVVLVVLRTQRQRQLRRTFGREYDRTVDRAEQRREAERDLEERLERREQLEIRPLSDTLRSRYREHWREIQHGFVDEPEHAIRRADGLIQDVMHERGYPVDDLEQRAADLSVDHPEVVEHYRAGHEIAGRPRPTTEELREAMLHFRALFASLVGDDTPRTSTPTPRS